MQLSRARQCSGTRSQAPQGARNVSASAVKLSRRDVLEAGAAGLILAGAGASAAAVAGQAVDCRLMTERRCLLTDRASTPGQQ